MGARPCLSAHFHDPKVSLIPLVHIPLAAVMGGHQGLWAPSWEHTAVTGPGSTL